MGVVAACGVVFPSLALVILRISLKRWTNEYIEHIVLWIFPGGESRGGGKGARVHGVVEVESIGLRRARCSTKNSQIRKLSTRGHSIT